MRHILIICSFMLFISNISHADIYKYTDENGVTCYTDTTFGKKTERVFKDNSNTSTDRDSFGRGSEKPKSYHRIIHEKASEYNLDPSLIKAVISTESNWNHLAISRKGAMGLMQLMPATADNMNVNNPFNPEENIEGGTKYLKYLLNRFNGDLTLALAAYNAGPKTVEKFGYIPPITETRQYVKKVMSLYNGKTVYTSLDSEADKKDEKPERIYKIILEDGSVLFTNSTLLTKNPVRF